MGLLLSTVLVVQSPASFMLGWHQGLNWAAISAIGGVAAPPASFDYKNGSYMLRGAFRHATICTAAPPAPNHGFTAYFDGRSCEVGAENRPRIEFFVGYNVPYEATSTFDLARHICSRRAIATSAMRVDGLKFLVCNEPDDHGFVAVNYVALRPPFPDQGDEPYGGTALIFTIHARRGELAPYRKRAYRLASELHLVPGRRE